MGWGWAQCTPVLNFFFKNLQYKKMYQHGVALANERDMTRNLCVSAGVQDTATETSICVQFTNSNCISI